MHGLKFQLRVHRQHLVSICCSFLDVVDHARTIEHIHRKAQGGNDKRARHSRNYSGSSLEAEIAMTDRTRGSLRIDISRVGPTNLFKRHYRLQRATSHVRVVPILPEVERVKFTSYISWPYDHEAITLGVF